MPMPVFELLIYLLEIYWWIVVVAVVMSWLVGFGVVNIHNPSARMIVRALDAVTDPLFRRIRRVLPDLGGIDISPMIVLIGIWFLERVVVWLALRYGF
ncbi:MAG TPA: YggT family protein [Rhizomicrobium sp.]|nr:YggT family protein [Rhizomicrobium sp.]